VFGVGGSNGAICGLIKSKMAADGHLGHTKMATTVVPVDVMCLHTCTAVARLTLALAKLSCYFMNEH